MYTIRIMREGVRTLEIEGPERAAWRAFTMMVNSYRTTRIETTIDVVNPDGSVEVSVKFHSR